MSSMSHTTHSLSQHNTHRGHQHLTPAERHEQLVEQSSKWVAQTFFGTLMKQMRESPFKSKLFDGGGGGEMFGTLYDQQLADHMGRSAGKKLVKALVHKIEGANAYAAASKAMKSAHKPAVSELKGRAA